MYTLEKVWPEWKIVKEIGRGSYGVVYKCVKEEKNSKQYAAIKVISVPRDEFEMEDVVSEKMTHEQSKAYYKDIADDLLKEIEILKSLKGTKNIVEIYDAKVVEKEDGIGWNIFISMEMLTDFTSYASDKKFTQEDVIKLGTDLCSALSVCHKARIIHRDIKPENIFVDDYGNFKLGDFGVAKQMAKTKGSVSVKGTYGYMSPEVFSGKKCDGRADLYSLALVMYKLLNNNRFPFIDAGKQIVKYSERQQAFERRIKGESIPAIKGIDNELNAAILKACSFRNVDRQKNIDEFRKQLEFIGKGKNSGKKVKIAVAIVAAVVVIVSAVTGILYASNDGFKEKVNSAFGKEPINNTETQKPENENVEIHEVASLGMGLNEYNSVNGEYLIEGKVEENAGKYYIVNEEKVVHKVSDLLGDKTDYRALAYDGEVLYYSVKAADKDAFDVYRYNFNKRNPSDDKAYISNVKIDSIVYFNDKRMYYVESEGEIKTLVKYEPEAEMKIEYVGPPIKDLFKYNRYIIISRDGVNYICYNTVDNARVEIYGKVAAGTKMQIIDDKLYFAEKIQDGSFGIKCFDFKSMNTKTESTDTEKEKAESYAEENVTEAPEVLNNTTEVARLDDANLVKNMPEASWKINCFNDKYAVVSNENAQDGEDKWYIWSYEYEEVNPILNADKIFVEGNYEMFIEDNLIKVAVWEGYSYKIYDISPSGAVQSYSDVFMEEKMDHCYRISDKYFIINTDGNMISEFVVDGELAFVENEEKVMVKVDSGISLNIRKAPTTLSKSFDSLSNGTEITRLGEINDDWSKVVVNGEIGYAFSKHLKKPELKDADKKNLISEVVEEYALEDVELIDYVNSGDECVFFLTGNKGKRYLYDVTLSVVAKLNENQEWEINSSESIEYIEHIELEGFNKYDNLSGFEKFSIYDINKDGIYEMIAHSKTMRKKHGVYVYHKDSKSVTMLGGAKGKTENKNEINAKSFELYELKDSGTLCYYDEPRESDGKINLVIVEIDEENQKIVEKKHSYTGSKDNIVMIESFFVNK